MSPELIPHPRALADELAAEFASVLGTLVGGTGHAAAVPDRVEPAWVAIARLEGGASGTLTIGLAEEDAGRLAEAVLRDAGTPAQGSIAGALGELSARAFDGLGQKQVAAGLTVTAAGAQPLGSRSPEGEGIAYRLTLTPEVPLTVGIWVRLERAAATAAAPASPGPTARRPPTTGSSEPYPGNIDVILDIDLPLSVRFGETELTLHALTRLGPGSVIDLGRSPDDPVDVLVNGRLVARGEVVVVAGNYGVRILEVVSAADRVRTLGA